MLRIQNATVYFDGCDGRDIHALDRVNLDIADGALVVALGASGCGKSTLLNAIAGFLPISKSAITLNGRAMGGAGADRGVVFQKGHAAALATVVDNVALGLKFAGTGKTARREKAEDLLALVGLKDFAKSFPYELSGGMRQRVGIARALVTEPDILLMYEPFGALDSLTREHMQELLISVWQRTGKRIFFITHSIEEALFLGTQVIVMSPRPGRVVARYELDFVRRFVETGDVRAIHLSPEFGIMREEIREILHGDHRKAELHA